MIFFTISLLLQKLCKTISDKHLDELHKENERKTSAYDDNEKIIEQISQDRIECLKQVVSQEQS